MLQYYNIIQENERIIDMKDKIITTSIPLFDKKGYSETSIQDIVDHIGVTKGTFYYYYKSKQELLRDINLGYIERLLDKQKLILDDTSKTYYEKLYNIIYMVIRFIRTQRQDARIFTREMRHLEEENLNTIKQKRHEFRLNLQAMLEEGIEAGEFKANIRADILTFGILGITNWSYYWFNPSGEISEKELTNSFMELIMQGINPN